MKAFVNTPITKERFIHHLKWHQEQDKIQAGHYGEKLNMDDFNGCAVGCSLNSVRIELGDYSISTDSHFLYEKYLGVPEWLALLEDKIFEGLPASRQKTFPVEFGEAINVGSDLNKIKPAFLVFVLEFNLEHLKNEKFKKRRDAVINCINLWKRDDLYSEEWESARYAALPAAWSVARCTGLAARSVANSAVNSVAKSVEFAGSAKLAAWFAAYEKFAGKLLGLMRAQKD